jgi:hypothetical protein
MSAVLSLVLLQSAAFLPEPSADYSQSSDDPASITIQEGVVLTDLPAMENGRIEFQMRLQRGLGFTGVLFRAESAEQSEIFYFRHHQTGNPDSWQYNPRYNGREAYQIYQGQGYGGVFDTPLGQWADVSLTVCGDQAEVKVDGKRAAFLNDLIKPAAPGRIGFWALRGERSIRNVTATPLEGISCELSEPSVDIIDQPSSLSGLIESWSVSQPMTLADAKARVGVAAANFTRIEAGHRGIADLNPVGPISEDKNSLIASAEIEASRDTLKYLKLGFSDDALVYLNGELLFAGTDRFRSRDYRFLGTVGWYDTIPLDLQSGTNRLDVIVSETEGGWAIAGRLLDTLED